MNTVQIDFNLSPARKNSPVGRQVDVADATGLTEFSGTLLGFDDYVSMFEKPSPLPLPPPAFSFSSFDMGLWFVMRGLRIVVGWYVG